MKYSPLARAVLDALLAKYDDEGVLNLDDANVLRIPPFNTMGSVAQLIKSFAGMDGFDQAARELQSALYRDIAWLCPFDTSSTYRPQSVRRRDKVHDDR
jgi:type I restriction enzyme, R subunit